MGRSYRLNLYEMTYIVRPDLEDEERTAVEGRVSDRVSGFGGEVVRAEGWGRRRLAYPIDHHRDGYYVTAILRMPGENLRQLENQLKLTPEVLRFLVIRQKESNVKLTGSLLPQAHTHAPAPPPQAAPAPGEAVVAPGATAEVAAAPSPETPTAEETPAVPSAEPALAESAAEAPQEAPVVSEAAEEPATAPAATDVAAAEPLAEENVVSAVAEVAVAQGEPVSAEAAPEAAISATDTSAETE